MHTRRPPQQDSVANQPVAVVSLPLWVMNNKWTNCRQHCDKTQSVATLWITSERIILTHLFDNIVIYHDKSVQQHCDADTYVATLWVTSEWIILTHLSKTLWSRDTSNDIIVINSDTFVRPHCDNSWHIWCVAILWIACERIILTQQSTTLWLRHICRNIVNNMWTNHLDTTVDNIVIKTHLSQHSD